MKISSLRRDGDHLRTGWTSWVRLRYFLVVCLKGEPGDLFASIEPSLGRFFGVLVWGVWPREAEAGVVSQLKELNRELRPGSEIPDVIIPQVIPRVQLLVRCDS